MKSIQLRTNTRCESCISFGYFPLIATCLVLVYILCIYYHPWASLLSFFVEYIFSELMSSTNTTTVVVLNVYLLATHEQRRLQSLENNLLRLCPLMSFSICSGKWVSFQSTVFDVKRVWMRINPSVVGVPTASGMFSLFTQITFSTKFPYRFFQNDNYCGMLYSFFPCKKS